MGWFDGKHDGKKVLLGDGALDRTHEYLEQIAAEYEEGADRKPTIEEIAALLEAVLGTSAGDYLQDCETKRVTGVAITAEKKPKIQEYAAGDVFAIPFGDAYVFGRVMSRENDFGALVEIFKETSSRLLVTEAILSSGRAVAPTIVSDEEVLPTSRWTVVRRDPKYKMSKEDEKLEFGAADIDEYWTETYLGRKLRDITREQWKKLPSNGVGTAEAFEIDVAKALKLPPPGKKAAKGKGKKKSR